MLHVQFESITLKGPARSTQPLWLRIIFAFVAASIFMLGSGVVFNLVGRENWNSLWTAGTHGLVALALIMLLVVQMRSISGIRSLIGQDVGRSLKLFLPLVLLVYLVCVGLDVGLGFPREDFMVNLFSGLSLPERVLCVLMLICLPPISEELFFRHFFVQVFPLNSQIWKWVAVLVTASMFMLIHSQYNHWPTLLLMALLGVLLALARIQTGGLLVPILMHSSAVVIGLSLNWVVAQWE